jgi:hypothetical protein
MLEFLAGPIIRRVTENRVCLWLAAANAANLKLSITDSSGAILGDSDPDDTPSYRSKLGQNLYIYLLQAKPHGNVFPSDTLLYYHIAVIDNANSLAIDFQQLGLTYAQEKHPSFFIPNQLHDLLYGSCRKPHGLEGLLQINPKLRLNDGLSRGDDALAKTYQNIEQRPALLILGGDQIYADEVAATLLEKLQPQAAQLLGYDEQIPGLEQNPAQIPLNGRDSASRQAGFSSASAANHLLAFGEFAAMYLYVFGNAQNWRINTGMEIDPARSQALEDFHNNLPKVRRLFANIPTYMLLDDHDVSDNWNITAAWYDRVRKSQVGRRVVANALAAYWAFQGWGNAPESFDPDLRWTIEQFLTDDQQFTGLLAQRYDLQLWKHRGWSFSIPTSPPIIAIDSRSQRQPDQDYNPPKLLDRYALDWLRLEWLKLQTRPKACPGWPIFVTASPVLGFAPIEWLQRLAIWAISSLESSPYIRMLEDALGKQGYLEEKIIEKFDAESWTANLGSLVDLLTTIGNPDRMGLRQCVFLSGDVHYAFTIDATFQTGQQPPLQCLQLTSSAFCNIPDDKTKRALARITRLANLNGGKAEHSAPPLWPWKTWKVASRLQPSDNYGSPGPALTTVCNIGLVKIDAQGKPALHQLFTGDGEQISYTL